MITIRTIDIFPMNCSEGSMFIITLLVFLKILNQFSATVASHDIPVSCIYYFSHISLRKLSGRLLDRLQII